MPIIRAVRFATCVSLLLLAGCGSDGQGEMTLTLASDTPCYGFEFDFHPGDALRTSCDVTPELASLGCEYAFTDGAGRFSAGGCFVPGGTRLFTCTGPSGVESRIGDSEVRCGCGCAEVCPEAPELVACHAGDLQCEASAHPLLPQPSGIAPSTITTDDATTTTHPPFCAECCDHLAESTIQLERSDTQVREVRFELSLPQVPDEFCPAIECAPSVFFDGPFRVVHFDRSRLEFCGSSVQGNVSHGRPIAYCVVLSGEPAAFEIANVRALDKELRPAAVGAEQGPDREP